MALRRARVRLKSWRGPAALALKIRRLPAANTPVCRCAVCMLNATVFAFCSAAERGEVVHDPRLVGVNKLLMRPGTDWNAPS